jgi:hypothetical protein
MFRFDVVVEFPEGVSDREKSIVISDESLEAAQAQLFAEPHMWMPNGASASTRWSLRRAREVFPPDYK